jgi:hypothetical protein
MQFRISRPNSRILICAPGNDAADLLLRKLSTSISTSDMVRIHAYQRNKNDVDEVTMRYSMYDDSVNAFASKTLDELTTKKFVVCTCIMASKLQNLKEGSQLQPRLYPESVTT